MISISSTAYEPARSAADVERILENVTPCAAAAAAIFPPTVIGPVWELDPVTGFHILPKYTLGWGVLGWITENLEHNGKPMVLTPEQARVVLWFYAIDKHGNRIHRKGVLQRLKG